MRLALQMYDLPELRWATDALAGGLVAALARAGFTDLPDGLDRELDYKSQWTQPDLLLAQTCGYPLATFLKGQVRYLATPDYGAPFCERYSYRSLLIVRRDDPALSLADLRGRRAAINRPYSQSGYNTFRHAVAPLADGGHFFDAVIETGGHAASAQAVSEGRADIAALDAVSHALLRQYRPEAVANLRVIGLTAPAPNLPFITRLAASDGEVQRLRQVLAEVMQDSALAEVRDALLLKGASVLPDEAYDTILEMEAEAERLGYAKVA